MSDHQTPPAASNRGLWVPTATTSREYHQFEHFADQLGCRLLSYKCYRSYFDGKETRSVRYELSFVSKE